MKESSPEPNLYELAKERKAVKGAIAEADKGNWPDSIKSGLEAEKQRISSRAKEIKLDSVPGKNPGEERPGFVQRFRADRARAEAGPKNLLEAAASEFGPTFTEVADLREKLADLRDLELQQLRKPISQDRYEQKARENLLKTIVDEKLGLEDRLKKLEKEDPRAYRAVDLVTYKQGLQAEGHIAPTPSVISNLEEIGTRMITGKPMFLHGPTGTGKTSLARFAAKHFTGQAAEMVYCNPQTREANIWGKTGIRPTESGAIQTVDIYGPLAKAASEGKVVVFDEFTALPREQQVFIKGIFNAKPGDEINIVGNGRTKIVPGFQMIFTANLKSEKNPERQELPPEIAREFEQNNLEIGYTPRAEAYDIMLARLMNPDGSVDLSWHDLNVTLPKFCEALEEIQIAYTDRIGEDVARLTGTLGASGKRQGLKKYVLTQGTVEAILESWVIEKKRGKTESFAEFLDDRLKISLTFKEYPEADRILAAKILASKGFLLTLIPEELSLPRNVFDFDASKKMREKPEGMKELMTESGKIVHVSIKELADQDPFGVRNMSRRERGDQFLDIEYEARSFWNGSEQIRPGQLIKDREGKISIFEGIAKDGSLVLRPYKKDKSIALDVSVLEKVRSPFMKDTFAAWGQNISDNQIKGSLENPTSCDYQVLEGDINAAKAGEYTLNPETQNLDFEHAKPFIPDLSAFEGQKLTEVAKHLVSTYDNKYYIPGIEYWQWLYENPGKSPVELDKSKYNFFFGSTLRNSNGHWSVPYVDWNGSEWDRDAYWLDSGWASDYRVVLLER